MKKRVIIILIIILAILLVLFGRWIYQRIQVSYDEDGKSVSMIGGADGPTSIFIAGSKNWDQVQGCSTLWLF